MESTVFISMPSEVLNSGSADKRRFLLRNFKGVTARSVLKDSHPELVHITLLPESVP